MKLLYIGSTSICAELDNNDIYYSSEEYEVFLNGEMQFTSATNVFSLFSLIPDTEYTLLACFKNGGKESVSFRTRMETCCLSVKDFGAVGDGVTDDTKAIQNVINFAPNGARIYFPEGTYLTFPLAIRSNITLELPENTILLGQTEREKYPIIPGCVSDFETGKEICMTSFEGLEQSSYMSLIMACYAENIEIVGPGKIDGNAHNSDWWINHKSFPAKRPRVLYFNRCKNVTLNGIKIENSPSWNIHPYCTENFSLYNAFVKAPKDSPNTDAMDPECCKNVNIIGCRFTVGDDCIAIKSGKIETARKNVIPAENHVIRNCLMEYGHGAVTLGSEISCGVLNLHVSQCYFYQTDRGLRIKSRRGRGKDCKIENVCFENIKMERVLTPLVINLWYNCVDPDRLTEYVWSREKLPVDDRTPHMGSFCFKDMTCNGCEVAAAYIDGLPESPIDKVEFENISVTFAKDAKPGVAAMMNFAVPRCKSGFYLDNVKEIAFKNVSIKGQDGEQVIASNYEKMTKEDSFE